MAREYPGAPDRGGRSQDRPNFVLLLRELRTAAVAEAASTGKARLLISIAAPTDSFAVGPGYDIAGLAPSLDWCGLMTYDFHGGWGGGLGGRCFPLHSLVLWGFIGGQVEMAVSVLPPCS